MVALLHPPDKRIALFVLVITLLFKKIILLEYNEYKNSCPAYVAIQFVIVIPSHLRALIKSLILSVNLQLLIVILSQLVNATVILDAPPRLLLSISPVDV